MRQLRIAATTAALLILSACGGDPAGPENGTLVFRAESNCPTTTVELTVDDVVKGQYAMHPGVTVQSFGVSAGNHTAEARQVGGSLAWGEVHFIVDPDQTYTLNMQC